MFSHFIGVDLIFSVLFVEVDLERVPFLVVYAELLADPPVRHEVGL